MCPRPNVRSPEGDLCLSLLNLAPFRRASTSRLHTLLPDWRILLFLPSNHPSHDLANATLINDPTTIQPVLLGILQCTVDGVTTNVVQQSSSDTAQYFKRTEISMAPLRMPTNSQNLGISVFYLQYTLTRLPYFSICY